MRERLDIGRQFESWSLSSVGFLISGKITDSLKIVWNRPEVTRDRLTFLVMIRMKTEVHSFRSQSGSDQSQTAC